MGAGIEASLGHRAVRAVRVLHANRAAILVPIASVPGGVSVPDELPDAPAILGLMKRVFEYIGDLSVSEVRPSDIEDVYVKLRETPTSKGKGWSGTSVRLVSKLLHNMFEHARREKIVTTNPVAEAIRPKADTEEREAMPFEESVRFERKLDPTDHHQLAVMTQMEAGLRIGEACGLRWEDIEDGYIHVRRTMYSDGTTGDPKTKDIIRVVPISATLAEALDKAKRNSEWVVGTAFGKPSKPGNMSCWWSKHRDELGLPGWTLHQFRHQFATNMAYRGINPRTMATLLGHSSPLISLQVYTHVEKSQTMDAIAQIEQAKEAVD